MLKLLFLFGAIVGSSAACVCGQPCTQPGGGGGVCQTNGECAVNIVAPRCPPTGATPKKECPMFKCRAPDCATAQQVTPKNADGCSLCPQCVTTAPTAAVKECPMFRCRAPECPAAQQETPKNAAGCSLCPVCVNTTSTTTNPNCPLVNCLTPKCPASEQETLKGPTGCPGCPTCKPSTKSCGVCGSACTVKKGKQGYCQSNGQCKAGKKAPLCPASPLCPKYKCVAPTCPTDGQETPVVNGCPRCPRCKGTCTADSDCGDNMFCNVATKTCIAYLNTGDRCPANATIGVRRCAPGSVCPSTTRTCTQCFPLPCPFIPCIGGVLEPTFQSNGCPGCQHCSTTN